MNAPSPLPIIPPIYQKLSLLTLGIVALFYALSAGAAIIVPLLFALLLAMLLDPVVSKLRRIRIPRVISIGIAVLFSMALLIALSYFIVTQAANLKDALPDMQTKLDAFYKDGQRWIAKSFDMRYSEVDKAVETVKDKGMAKSENMVGQTLTTVGALFGFFFLLPVFTFLILLYKKLLVGFVQRLFSDADQPLVRDVLNNTRTVVQSYLVGLLFETVIVAALNWTGLTLLGVKYALLLAVLGALLNLIPYIGMIIATLFPMAIALATQEPVVALWVLGLYLVIQFLDNNFIVPAIVASRVEINALVSIVVVMVGGALWGIPGMFLSLPLVAILKVIFDRVPGLQPFGYVLGDTEVQDERDAFRVKALKRGK